MKVKVMQVRLDAFERENDEAALNAFLREVNVLQSTSQFTADEVAYWSVILFYQERSEVRRSKSDGIDLSELSAQEMEVFQVLKQWRNETANGLRIPSYQICHNAHLVAMAKSRPEEVSDLLKIPGMGERKVQRFGADLIAVLNAI